MDLMPWWLWVSSFAIEIWNASNFSPVIFSFPRIFWLLVWRSRPGRIYPTTQTSHLKLHTFPLPQNSHSHIRDQKVFSNCLVNKFSNALLIILNYCKKKTLIENVSSIRSNGGDVKQGVDDGVPDRNRCSPLRRSGWRQHSAAFRQQIRFGEVRSSQATPRSHRSRLRRPQFLPSGHLIFIFESYFFVERIYEKNELKFNIKELWILKFLSELCLAAKEGCRKMKRN